jgi:hypothetical protein
MFKLTGSAYQKLEDIVIKERITPDEKLFIRLSMGIG